MFGDEAFGWEFFAEGDGSSMAAFPPGTVVTSSFAPNSLGALSVRTPATPSITPTSPGSFSVLAFPVRALAGLLPSRILEPDSKLYPSSSLFPRFLPRSFAPLSATSKSPQTLTGFTPSSPTLTALSSGTLTISGLAPNVLTLTGRTSSPVTLNPFQKGSLPQ